MDISTLFAAQSVMLLTYTVVLALVARSQPDLKGIRWITSAFAILTAGTFLGRWLGGPFDAWVVSSRVNRETALHGKALGDMLTMLDDVLMLVPLLLARNGLAEFVGRDARRRRTDLPILLAAVAGIAWFTVVRPSPVGRDFVFSLATGIVAAMCCYLLVRFRPEGARDATHAMLAVIGVVALGANVRVLSILLAGAPLMHFLPGSVAGPSILFRMVACFSVVFCFLWMVTEKLRGSLEEMAHTDYLTGTLNRRFLRTCAEREITLSERTFQPLSVLVIDIDHFKLVNDTYGHSMGDESLRRVAGVLREVLRRTDLLARYGGEEFVIVLPGTTGEDALVLAERLRTKIEALSFAGKGGRVLLTASFGVAEYRHGAETWDALLGRADFALYAAKQAGRNRTVLAAAP